MVLRTAQTPPSQSSPPHTPPSQLTPPTPPDMSVTEAQAARIAAYHEARKPYTKLLFEAMDDAPANTTNTIKEQASDMKQEGAKPAQPLPGAHFAELVEVLMESKIVNVEEKGAKRKL